MKPLHNNFLANGLCLSNVFGKSQNSMTECLTWEETCVDCPVQTLAQAGSPTPDCPVYSQGSNIFNDITWKTNFFLTIVAGQMVKKYNVNRFKGKFSNEKRIRRYKCSDLCCTFHSTTFFRLLGILFTE